MKRILVVTSIAITLLSTSGFGGLTRKDGSERELWTTHRFSVVVGTLKDIKRKDEPGWYEAKLVPVATISGSFDCGAYATLPISFYAMGVSTSIQDIPKENSTVMGFMQFLPKVADGPADHGFFSASICHFMPSESALVTIKGLEDPVVRETLVRIQKVRREE